MRRALLLAALGALSLGGLLFLWASGDPDDKASAGESSSPAGAEAAGESVPNFSLPALAPYQARWGDTLRYRDFEGMLLVINVWASWCPPCRREAPVLEAAWQQHKQQVQFIGINYQDQEAGALEFIEQFGQTFPSGADPRGEVGRELGVLGVPTTYFVDAEGTIRHVKVGEIEAEELEANVQQLLADNGQ